MYSIDFWRAMPDEVEPEWFLKCFSAEEGWWWSAGQLIKIRKMTTRHLLNSIKWIEKIREWTELPKYEELRLEKRRRHK